MSDLITAVATVSRAAPDHARGARFYSGEISEVFASQAIKRLIGNTAKEYKINLAGRVVDAVLDRLKIAAVSVPGSDELTAKLNAEWDKNRLGRVNKTLFRTGLSEGEAYLVVQPDPVDEQGVEIHFRSPRTTKLFYDPENPHRKSHAAFVWQVGSGEEGRIRVNLLYADRTERYISKKGTKGEADTDFEQFMDEEQTDWLIENPFGEVPVFHFRTDDTGRPIHSNAFGPQNIINKFVAVHVSAVDFQGFPQRYLLRGESTTPSDATGYPADPDDDEGFKDGDDGVEGGPGTIMDFKNAKEAGQFAAADAKNFLESINFYARAMGASTGTPLRFMDPTGDVPSGESLRADDAPLAEKISDIQTWFGDEYRSMLRYAMKVAGSEVATIELAWRPVQVVSDKEGWETVRAKIDAGVPQEVALSEAGYRPEVVQTWLKGSETTNLATRVELVGKIAQAMQGLGTAVQLGVVSQEQVQQVVAELLGDSTEQDGDEEPS